MTEEINEIKKSRVFDIQRVILVLLVVSVALNFLFSFFIFYVSLFNTSKILVTLKNFEYKMEGRVDVPISAPEKFLGKADAPVTLVEFADYQCPYCEKFFTEVFPKLKQNYIDTGKVKFYFQDFAFLGQESWDAAEAAKCAGDQGKYWKYHDYLYGHQKGENEGAFSVPNLKGFAKTMGLKEGDFNVCMDTHVNKPFVEAETAIGQSLDISATPSVFINGKKYEGAGSYEIFARKIDEELKK